MEEPVNILRVFDLVNFIASMASLILSILAIGLTLYFKRESDRVNTDTRNLLIDVKTDAKALTAVGTSEMAEISEFGKTFREVTRHIVIGQADKMKVNNFSTSVVIPEASSVTEPPNQI